MKIRLLLVGVVVGLIVLLAGDTLRGLCAYKFGRWGENAYKGKPLSELENALNKQNRTLEWCDVEGFYARTSRQLKQNQRVLAFTRGKTYSLFWVGNAVNKGYVVIERFPEGEVVVDIVPSIHIDSL